MKARVLLPFLIVFAVALFAARSKASPVDCSTLPGPQAKACAVQQLHDITKADRDFQHDLQKAFESMTKKGGAK